MRIELTDNWVIQTDENNFALLNIRIVQEGENAGNTYEVSVGYYSTLEASLKGFIKHSLRKDQDTVALRKVGEKIDGLYNLIKGIKVENLDPKIVKKDEVMIKADSKETKGNISKESKTKAKSKGELAKENLDKKSKETKASKTTKIAKTNK